MENKKELFDNFLNKYRDMIDKLQNEEKKKQKKIINKLAVELTILAIIVFIFLYLVHVNNIGRYYEIVIVVLSILLALLLMTLNFKLLIKAKENSCYVINVLIYECSLSFLTNRTFSFNVNGEIAEEDFNRMKLFNMNYLNYTGNFFTTATYKDKKIAMCDVWLYDLVERIKTDSYYSKATNTTYITNYHYRDRVDIFKGLYYETTINRDNNEYIYMIPNNISDKFIRKNIYHYITYKGSKIELENLDFSERYSVFSLDEIKSRYVLSLTLMEKINKIDQLLDNKKYFVFKSDGRVGIFIDRLQQHGIFDKKFNINKKISKEYINNIFMTVNNILDISQILEDFKPYD